MNVRKPQVSDWLKGSLPLQSVLAARVRLELLGIEEWEWPLLAGEKAPACEVTRHSDDQRITVTARTGPGQVEAVESAVFTPCPEADWVALLASVREWVGARRASGQIAIGEAWDQAVRMPESMRGHAKRVTADDLRLALAFCGWHFAGRDGVGEEWEPSRSTRPVGRPRTGSTRIDFAADAPTAAWLKDRAERMPHEGSSASLRARADLGLLRTLLDASLAELPALTLGEALALAEITGGSVMSSSVAGPDSRPLLWRDAAVAFADARAGVGGLPPHPDNAYAAMFEIDEDGLLSMLASLTRVQDYALRDTLSRFWQADDSETADLDQFAAVGLRITEG